MNSVGQQLSFDTLLDMFSVILSFSIMTDRSNRSKSIDRHRFSIFLESRIIPRSWAFIWAQASQNPSSRLWAMAGGIFVVRKIDKSIDIDRSISISLFFSNRASSPFHRLSFEPKIIKIYKVTDGRTYVPTNGIWPPILKTNSLRWSSGFAGARSRASRVSQLREW